LNWAVEYGIEGCLALTLEALQSDWEKRKCVALVHSDRNMHRMHRSWDRDIIGIDLVFVDE
jgi:hypothetical protein